MIISLIKIMFINSSIAEGDCEEFSGCPVLTDIFHFTSLMFLHLQQNVKEFLVPLRPVAIRIARNMHGNKTGNNWLVVFVRWETSFEKKPILTALLPVGTEQCFWAE